MDIVLIGSGNVATQLGRALCLKGHRIRQVYSRNRSHAEELASTLNAMHGSIDGDNETDLRTETVATDVLAELHREAAFYFICVSDQHIQEVIAGLPATLNGVVVHTSGSTSINVFSNYPQAHGVFYPVQTFSKTKNIEFDDIPLALEASDPNTFRVLQKLADTLSSKGFACDSDQRLAIHIAAVFACNFTNHLYALAEHLLGAKGLDFDLIRPLIRETADKAMQYSPSTVQTGPASRGDARIVDKHLEFLSASCVADPRPRQVYQLLSAMIWDAKKYGLHFDEPL